MSILHHRALYCQPKQAMLHLQFKHLQISLRRNPYGGPPVPMFEIEPQFAKNVLGMFNVYVRGSQRYTSSDPAPAYHMNS
jgi:hypothetical protein